MEWITCPKCGHENPATASICQNSACRALMTTFGTPKKAEIAPDAHRSPTIEKWTQDDQSYQPTVEIERNATPDKPVLPVARSQKRPKRIGRWVIGVAAVLTIPVVYAGGYWQHIHTELTAGSSGHLPHIIIKGGITGTAPANPTHGIASVNGAPSQAVSHYAPKTTPKQSNPVGPLPTKVQPVIPTVPAGVAQLSGTITNGQLQTTVWVGLSPQGPLYPVLLMVDTGAQTTMVSGHLFQSMGDAPTSQTGTFSGIGGNESVGYWPNVYIYPQDKAVDPIIAGGTEPGGIFRSVLGPEGISILLGQNIIQTGSLTQQGSKWTLTYPVQ